MSESPHLHREANKSALADALWATAGSQCTRPTRNLQYVLDGGSLIQKLPWPTGQVTYEDISKMYNDFVKSKYGSAIIGFDRYSTISTKNMTHFRRSKGVSGVLVSFTANMRKNMKKKDFLNNSQNKENFIQMLSAYVECMLWLMDAKHCMQKQMWIS